MILADYYTNQFKKAKTEYEIALQHESLAEEKFIDVAIFNTNAAKLKLDNVIRTIKLLQV